jgi:hypothetical protein
MEKITATVRFWYSTEIEVEVEDPEDQELVYEKVEDIANEIKVWNGNHRWTTDFDDYEIEY